MSLYIHFRGKTHQLQNPRLPSLKKLQEFVSMNLPGSQLPKTWFFEDPSHPNSQEKFLDEEGYKALTSSVNQDQDQRSIELKIIESFENRFREIYEGIFDF